MFRILMAMVTRKCSSWRKLTGIVFGLAALYCLFMLPVSIAGSAIAFIAIAYFAIVAKTRNMKLAFIFTGIMLFTFVNGSFDALLKIAAVGGVFYLAVKKNRQP